jgi:hypothetical protein
MTAHPYADAAPYRKWRQAMAADVDPMVAAPFRITPEDRVVTAGSCFAQHIARRLRDSGFTFLVTEPAHPLLPADLAEQFHYAVYSARYGNIYTARQLLQLWRRARGEFAPAEACWEQNGRFFDPLRPAVQPNGFASRLEFDCDQARHLAAVREAFAAMDVFVFTLGLTECWVSAVDGCAFPVCPGTVAGEFDPGRHRLVNFTADEVTADLRTVFAEMRAEKPGLRVVLTVSPVPLAATALDQHVLAASTYSKAVLRVAAEMVTRDDPLAVYFPSFEIITGPHAGGRYFGPDRRAVTEEGVDHVMRVFLRHMTVAASVAPVPAEREDFFTRSQRLVAVLCEEEALGE